MKLKTLPPKQREMWRVNKYIWFCLFFLVLWLAATFGRYDPAAQRGLLWVFAAGFVNVSLRTYVAYRSPEATSGKWGWYFTSVDIGLIALAIHLTGGLRSELWLVYFLLVVTETLSLSIKQEVSLLGLTCAGYTASVWPLTDPVTYAMRLFFLYLVSAIARRLYLNAELRSQQLIRLRGELVTAQEQGRMARELHDGLGREMVNVILGLEVAKRLLSRNPEQVPAVLEENIALLRTAMNDTRSLIFQLRPWTQESDTAETLADQVERYARQFGERTRLAITVECYLGESAIHSQMAFGLLRIIQEALNNIAKHAQASHVMVCLQREERFLSAEVSDNGIGFDSSAVKLQAGAGIGLAAMQERAVHLGGILTVESQLGRGTTIIVRIPL